MAETEKPGLAKSFGQPREKDFPYFRRLWNSIVVALLAASFVPLLVIGGGLYYFTVSLIRERTLDSLQMEVSEHREAIDRFLDERAADLKLLASNLGLDYLTRPGAVQDVFQSLQSQVPCFTDLGIIDDEGRHLAYIGPYDLLSKNYRDSPWFKAMNDQDVYVSDVFLGFRKEPHFIIAVKQVTDGGFWILRATVDSLYFNHLVTEVLSRRSGDAFLVNRSGVFQTTPRSAGELMGQSEIREQDYFEDVKIVERKGDIYLLSWLGRVPWLIAAKFSQQEIYRPLRHIRNLGIAVLAVSVLIIVFTVFLTTNYLFMRLETKRRNIRFLDEQLRHSSKAASSMKIASSLVRDINDHLSNMDVVATWVEELLHKDLSLEDNRKEIAESLKQIKSEVSRTRQVTEKFLKATRPTMPLIQDVQMHHLLDDLLDLLDRELHFNRITVKKDYQEGLPSIKSDPSQLRQVFQNLMLNAIASIQKEGQITLGTSLDKEGIKVSVEDNGPGIPVDVLDKIFDPLFTSKPDGTGLGLSISARILEKLGGRISADSKPGKGARFTVDLPYSFRAHE